MTIHRVKVENVKGAKCKDIKADIFANKPSLLVAPNGFGKSSITAAFSSLNQSRLKLDEENFHEGKPHHKPSIIIEATDASGNKITLCADENKNEIHSHFDVFVINSRLQAKATKRNLGGFTTASASMEVREVVLIDKIPKTIHFGYSIAKARKTFGNNGKCLPSVDCALNNFAAIEKILERIGLMGKISGVRIKDKLAEIIGEINQQCGSTESVLDWIDKNVKVRIEEINPISEIADIICAHVPEINDRVTALLSSYQICNMCAENPKLFKDACEYALFVQEKDVYKNLISSFDTTWKSIQPREVKGQLIVKFPEALHISNGQRDSLVFAAMMQRIKIKIAKKNAIVIIDEVFDYLDDANLTAVQYYISNLIDEAKKEGKRIYPLIFTHLNPLYFKNYAFQDQKVYFIDKRTPKINEHLQRLIQKRDEPSIKSGIERHHLHFCPTDNDLQNEFKALGLKQTWGKSDVFRAYTEAEWNKYRAGNDEYDPFAVCCYVRVKIEEVVYKKITDPTQQSRFIDENGTKKKLLFAKSQGANVPEVCFLLGVIYNEGLHIKSHADNSSPIVAKLEHIIIRKMTEEATNG